MSEDAYDHDFEAEDACDVCGEEEDAAVHDSEDDDFDHDYEEGVACAICGMDEADEAHQDES